jgi:hypothetical protein
MEESCLEIQSYAVVIAFPLGIIFRFCRIKIKNVLAHHIPEQDFIV